MKTVSRIKAKEAGKYRSSVVDITVTMNHNGLTRDEAIRAKHYMEDEMVTVLLKDTFAANIKVKVDSKSA